MQLLDFMTSLTNLFFSPKLSVFIDLLHLFLPYLLLNILLRAMPALGQENVQLAFSRAKFITYRAPFQHFLRRLATLHFRVA